MVAVFCGRVFTDLETCLTCKPGGERERERDRQTDRQTVRQRDRDRERQRQGQRDRE